MSDNLAIKTYHADVKHRDDETTKVHTPVSEILVLQRLLAARDHEGFIDAFESACANGKTKNNDFLRALGGEGMCLLFDSLSAHPDNLAGRYSSLLLAGHVLAPPDTIRRLAGNVDNDELKTLISTMEASRYVKPDRKLEPKPNAFKSDKVVFQVRRVVQLMQMFMGNGEHSDSTGIRRSVFRSQQERTFVRALSLRFPGLLALPNYPLDQIANLDRIGIDDSEIIRYGHRCRLDAILVIPDEGDAVAAFELDSQLHDQPDDDCPGSGRIPARQSTCRRHDPPARSTSQPRH